MRVFPAKAAAHDDARRRLDTRAGPHVLLERLTHGLAGHPHAGKERPGLDADGGCVDCSRRYVGMPSTAAIVGNGTPAATAAMPKAWRSPFGQACGPEIPAHSMTATMRRWPVARDQGQSGSPARLGRTPRSPWTSSRARSVSAGSGTSRQCSARRLSVRIRIAAASRSMSMGRSARTSESLAPE